ncbi:DUF2179 domain-containing protein [Melioribacteraceae bacterium 4301-Me]|uniref:DUF2179 domain-containing protein n=1 Tax=Pyranulibacter aquaticus TaxID=3163344 RepID=UPI0035967DAD
MFDIFYGAILIMFMRICDVTIGTFRTLLVVQGKKYAAGLAGFFEVLIWIFAMRYIVQHMDNVLNLIGYAAGFATGNVFGITLEQYFAFGYVQVNIISKHYTDKIADMLRKSRYGVTILPGEGSSGGVSILIIIIRRRDLKEVMKNVEEIDPKAFITVQHSRPYRGYIHGPRK